MIPENQDHHGKKNRFQHNHTDNMKDLIGRRRKEKGIKEEQNIFDENHNFGNGEEMFACREDFVK